MLVEADGKVTSVRKLFDQAFSSKTSKKIEELILNVRFAHHLDAAKSGKSCSATEHASQNQFIEHAESCIFKFQIIVVKITVSCSGGCELFCVQQGVFTAQCFSFQTGHEITNVDFLLQVMHSWFCLIISRAYSKSSMHTCLRVRGRFKFTLPAVRTPE